MLAQFMQSMITQQFQNFQQSIVSDFIESQVLQNSSSSASSFANSTEKILNVFVDTRNDEKHTQFLNIMIEMNKAF